jgi:phosphoribosylanthranilate isomerase
MTLTKIKICGITDLTELKSVMSAGPDAVGFVVEVADSRHSISALEARELISRVPVYTKSVAVIAPEDVSEALSLARMTGADVLQVHGTLSPEEVGRLKGMVGQKIVASVPSGSRDLALQFSEVADAVLLDTLKDGKLGGTGEVHDWSLSADLARSLSLPVILAGGLNPSNVSQAIRSVRPYAVDVSSGVELQGRKDLDLARSFVSEVRSCL